MPIRDFRVKNGTVFLATVLQACYLVSSESAGGTEPGPSVKQRMIFRSWGKEILTIVLTSPQDCSSILAIITE